MIFGVHLEMSIVTVCVVFIAWLLASAIHSLFDTSVVVSREHLAPGIETVGVTSVTGLRWTR